MRTASPERSCADRMKQTAYVSVPLAAVLVLLLNPAHTIAQQINDAGALQETRTAVAHALGVASADVTFDGLKLVRDKFGTLVCGLANGKRFLAGPAGKPPPQIEGALDASMFNYLWNARCKGMSASTAEEIFRHEMN